jgi:hypothetical protein
MEGVTKSAFIPPLTPQARSLGLYKLSPSARATQKGDFVSHNILPIRQLNKNKLAHKAIKRYILIAWLTIIKLSCNLTWLG